MSKSVFRVRALVVAIAATLLLAGLPSAAHAAEPAPPQPVIAANYGTTCAVRENQRVYCWGDNSEGQLGRGHYDPSLAVRPVGDGLEALAVAGGGQTFCALKTNHTVACWGRGDTGRLGNGSSFGSYLPVAVTSLTNVAALDVGPGRACVAKQDGTVWCWGADLGANFPGSSSGDHTTPVQIAGLSSVIGVAVGDGSTCALKIDHTVWCWGMNWAFSAGAPLGVHYTPTKISGLTDATQISMGDAVSCALRATGGVACWGDNNYGGLGAAYSGSNSGTPLQVWRLTGAKELAVGALTSCARTVTVVKCWGLGGYGALGDGQGDDTRAPVTATAGLSDPTSVAVGESQACEIASGGRVWCWGMNIWGEAGDGTTDPAYDGTGPWDDFGIAADREVIPLLNRAPGTPAGSSLYVSKIKISWAAPSTTNGTSAPKDYTIQYRLKGTTTWKTFSDPVTATRTATVTGLSSGKYYQFRVLPKNWAGTGTPSATSLYIKSK